MGPCLPHGLSVINTYTKMTTGSKQLAVVVKNLTATPITIAKGIKVIQVVSTNAVTQVEVVLGTLEKLDKIKGIQQTRMSVEWGRETFFHQLELSGLEGWSNKTKQLSYSCQLNIMTSLPWNLDSWGVLTWQSMRSQSLMMSPSRRRYQRILPPMVDEFHVHMKGMLEVGAINPSLSWWCIVIVLVCKKDGGLQFCIDFQKLNARTKKDSYLLPQIQEAIKSLVDTGYFPFSYLKAGFLEDSKRQSF